MIKVREMWQRIGYKKGSGDDSEGGDGEEDNGDTMHIGTTTETMKLQQMIRSTMESREIGW
jgi:hypothetical protein